MEPANSKWIHVLRKLDALLITPRALATAQCGGGEVSQQHVLLANQYLNRMARQGRLTRLESGVYALPGRLTEHEPLADRLVEALTSSGWRKTVDVWRAYLLIYAAPHVRDALWRKPNRGALIRRSPDYSARLAEAAVLALWVAARKGAMTRLRRGVYALPGTVQPDPDPFALSTRMGDPIITHPRGQLLVARWRGLLDDDQVQELWDAPAAQIRAALQGIHGLNAQVYYYFRRERGLLVKITYDQRLYRALAERGNIPRLHHHRGGAWRRALKLALSRSNTVGSEGLARAYLELCGGDASSGALKMAQSYLARLARKGEIVRVGPGEYTTHERAAEAGVPAYARPSRPWCSPQRLMDVLRRSGWQGAIDPSRAYLLVYASPDARDALWRRADRELLLRDLEGYSPLHYQYASAALCEAARLGWLVRLRKGVYALPGTIQPEDDMAALSLWMPDPLVTPRRAKLLHAYWVGRLDENQVAELWDADDARVKEALGAFDQAFLAAHYAKQALQAGCLVKLGRGRYVHPKSGYAA